MNNRVDCVIGNTFFVPKVRKTHAQGAARAVGSLIQADGTINHDPHQKLYQNNGRLMVFDKHERRWRKMNISDIPWTYTLTPRPTNYRMEARLWLFAARRVKHRFIWARERIPREEFACIKSKGNSTNYGRYFYTDF